MFIFKNALRNIWRSKGRSILIGCIAFVIGFSSCLALSIKQAAIKEKEEGLSSLAITATISADRMKMMQEQKSEAGEDDASDRQNMMKGMQSLSIAEMQTYAKAKSVKVFYYTASLSLNGSSLEAVSTQTQREDVQSDTDDKKPGFMQMNQGDFTITGYSSYAAMSEFVSGNAALNTGAMFSEGKTDLNCVINQELATLNSIKVGDTITLTNPSNEKETVILKVSGIYETTSSDTNEAMGMNMMDPANQIYMSYEAVNAIMDSSSQNTTNTENSTQLQMQTRGTYVFADIQAYESFEGEVRTLGLSDSYVVSSSDLNAYERSLQPLENLSTYATYFLVVILVIGGAILIVLNIYHIRERKYEIGVLAAIGMMKSKIASQFIMEIFVVTFLSIMIGTGIGAATSLPITNTLLSNQTTSSQQDSPFGDIPQEGRGQKGNGEQAGGMRQNVSYIDEVSSATDVSVIIQLVGISVLLTIISGGIAVMSILRYEPLKILSNRE